MAEELTISIIAEGPTDYVVLTHVLTSFTEDKNILFTPLQPKRADDGEWGSGNWDKVFKYCSSDDFKKALIDTHNFVVIQIDSDWLLGDSVPKEYRVDGIAQMNPLEVVSVIRDLLISQIGLDFYNKYHNRIVFAIAVDSIECWFLSIYFPKGNVKAAKHTNCIDTLNKPLYKKEGFYIDAKDLKVYREICKNFKKKDDLLNYSKPNDSFRVFIEELANKLPQVQEEQMIDA